MSGMEREGQITEGQPDQSSDLDQMLSLLLQGIDQVYKNQDVSLETCANLFK